MRLKIAKTLIITVTLLICGVNAFGQQTSLKNSSINELKEVISKLESVERDASTSSEVKELNRSFLTAKRSQLHALLQKRINALQSYQSTVASSLSGEENRLIENSIQELMSDLRKLEGDIQVDSPSVSSTVADVANSSPGSSSPPSPVVSSASNTPVQTTAAPACNLFRKNPNAFSLVDQYICNLAADVQNRKTVGEPRRSQPPNPVAGLELDTDYTRLFIILDAKKGRAEEFIRAEESRTDKQVGGDSSNSGSTTLVTKGNIPAILGFAVENGALEREVSGTTVTFRGNPVGIIKALANQGLIGGYDTDDATTRFLRRLSFGVSFDTDRGQEAGVFTGDKQQISAISARVVLFDKRDPRRAEYKKDWEDFLANSALPFLKVDAKSRDALLVTDATTGVTTWKDPALISWYDDTQRALAAASSAEVENVLIDRLNKFPLDDLAPETVNYLADFERQFKIFLRDRNTILKKVGQAGVVTLDYVNDRQVNKPDLSKFTIIGEKGFRNGRLDLTGNGTFTIFNKEPVGAGIGRLRDAQASFQLDGTFGSAEKTGVFVLSFAYKYQRMMEDAMTLAGTTVPDTRGDISVGQLKFTVPIKGLGMKFPISVTFANRTELVKEKEVRGNFGFTFDLDSIFAKFKPF